MSKVCLVAKNLFEVSKSLANDLSVLSELKENEKVYISHTHKLYKDGFGFMQPLTRLFLFRGRYQTIEDLEELFQKYFILVDNIFSFEKQNRILILYHQSLIDNWIRGLSNLKFTYENSNMFRNRADTLLLKLISIKKDIDCKNYLLNNPRSYSC